MQSSHLRKPAVAIVAAIALLTVPLLAAVKKSNKSKVSVAGIRLVAKPYHKKDQMRAFNWFTGTSLVLEVQHPAGNLIDIDHHASKLTRFTDDKGTNLLATKERFQHNGIKDATMSKDGKAALVEIDAVSLPASGATKIEAKGVVVFKSATGKKPVKAKDVALKAGTKIKAGPVSVKIKKIGKPQWGGDMPLEVTLTNESGLSKVADVKFFDAKGKLIKSRNSESWSMNGKLAEKTYDLGKKVKTVTIEFDIWQGLKQVKVPFDVKTSVGLSTK